MYQDLLARAKQSRFIRSPEEARIWSMGYKDGALQRGEDTEKDSPHYEDGYRAGVLDRLTGDIPEMEA